MGSSYLSHKSVYVCLSVSNLTAELFDVQTQILVRGHTWPLSGRG